MSTPQTGPYTSRPFDEAAVSDALAGGRPYLSPASRSEVIRRLSVRGVGVRGIAARLGCCTATVYRALRR